MQIKNVLIKKPKCIIVTNNRSNTQNFISNTTLNIKKLESQIAILENLTSQKVEMLLQINRSQPPSKSTISNQKFLLQSDYNIIAGLLTLLPTFMYKIMY